jgi:hypothetical protein
MITTVCNASNAQINEDKGPEQQYKNPLAPVFRNFAFDGKIARNRKKIKKIERKLDCPR